MAIAGAMKSDNAQRNDDALPPNNTTIAWESVGGPHLTAMTRITSEGSDQLVVALAYEGLTHEIIGSFYTSYNQLGFGYLEPVYANALALEMKARGLEVRREVPFDIRYRNQIVGHYRCDMVVNGVVVVEVKASATIGEPERRQLLNYLRGTGLPIGLLLHFGPKPWFKRMVGQSGSQLVDPDQNLQK
jgi:GxxExxY protein